LLICGAAAAQTTGSIEGVIRDTAGGALPGVQVRTSGSSLPGARAATTDRYGRYWVPGLPSGTYSVEATLPGFRSATREIAVLLDTTTTVDFVLEPSLREEVSVSGEAPLVDVTSATSGTSYTQRLTARLPVSRNYADIVRANPGVSTDRALTQGRSLPVTIYGSTSVENLWLIEGVNTTNVVFGIQGKLLNDEFVQEVQVKSGGYGAEYGGALGGVINVVTKSGGNTFHGGGFVYWDSGSTRAEPVITSQDFVGDQKVTPENHWDFGVDLGGFLVKDRLWFYGVYNRVDAPQRITSYDPTDPARFPLDTIDTLYGAKLTANASSSTTLVATVFADSTTRSGAACGDPIASVDPGSWQCRRLYGGLDAALRWNQLLGSRVFTTLQVSQHRDSFELEPTGAGAAVHFEDKTCEEGTPDLPCEPADPPNLISGGLGYIFGPTDNSKSRRWQYRGDATLYLGSHEIKAGVEYQNDRVDTVTFYTGGQAVTQKNEFGQIYYQHDFFARSSMDLTPVDAPARPRTSRFGLYAQDSFRAGPGLTINAGLRWDQHEIGDDSGATILKTSNDWQPRLGIVWDPKADGKTRVYASAGRFYYALPLDLAVQAFANQVIATTFNFDPVGLTQASGIVNHPDALVFGNAYGEPVDAGLKGIYQDELTVGVERLLSPGFTIGLKGTYRRFGRAIEDRCDVDYATTGYSCVIVNLGSSGRFARGDLPTCNGLDYEFHACSDTGVATPAARRLYRGIEVLARKQIGDRFWIQASYVYSSLRGNYDGLANSFGQTNPGILIDFDYPEFSRNTYGRLGLDHPHQARLDLTYTFPFRAFVGLGAFVQSGAPKDRIGFAHESREFFVPVYLVPRGSAGRLPTLWEADLTAGWPFAIGPLTVTAQVYVFNLFNNQFPTGRRVLYRAINAPGYPDSIYDPNVPRDYVSPRYDQIVSRQDPRLFRMALKISF
jgi:hypothetical protein